MDSIISIKLSPLYQGVLALDEVTLSPFRAEMGRKNSVLN